MSPTVATLLGLLVVAAVTIAVLASRFARYRATYTKTNVDIAEARRHSVQTSRGTLLGNAAEQLAPFMPGMIERFAPADCRFIGSPVDFVVFDGLVSGDVSQVVLVEVKSGSRRLSPIQSNIVAKADAGVLPLSCEIVSPGTAASRRSRRPPS